MGALLQNCLQSISNTIQRRVQLHIIISHKIAEKLCVVNDRTSYMLTSTSAVGRNKIKVYYNRENEDSDTIGFKNKNSFYYIRYVK